jgi:hypothetical protein
VDDSLCLDYFLQPTDTFQRHYEALRAYFVERRPLHQIAAQFGFTYDSLRSLIRDFRVDRRTDTRPPFSPRTTSVGRSVRARDLPPREPRSRTSPIGGGWT